MLLLEDLQGLTRQALKELQNTSPTIANSSGNNNGHKLTATQKNSTTTRKSVYSEGDPVQVKNEDGDWLFALVEQVKGSRIAIRLVGHRRHEKLWLDSYHRSLRPFEENVNFLRYRRRYLTQYAVRNGISMLMTLLNQADRMAGDFEESMRIWFEEHLTSLWQSTCRETRSSLGKTIEAPERFDSSSFVEKRSVAKTRIVEYFPKRKPRVEGMTAGMGKSGLHGTMIVTKRAKSLVLHQKSSCYHGKKHPEIKRQIDDKESTDDDEAENEDDDNDAMSYTDEQDLEYQEGFHEVLDREEIETQAMINDEILLDLEECISLVAKISRKKGSRILVDYVHDGVHLQRWLDLTEIRAFKMTSEYIERLRNEGHPQLSLECKLRMRARKQRRQSLSLGDGKEATIESTSDDEDDIVLPDGVDWIYAFVCNYCGKNIKDVRLYCRYCRNPEDPDDNFDLCLSCFQYEFPDDHEHPKSSFSMQTVDYVYYQQQGEEPSKKSRCVLVKDVFLDETPNVSGKDFFDVTMKHEYRTCILCGDFEDGLSNRFLSEKPLVRLNERKEEKGFFWIHDACARYSPEVCRDAQGNWYNIASAVRRGRSIVSRGYNGLLTEMGALGSNQFCGFIWYFVFVEMFYLQEKRGNNRLFRAEMC
jgi:hypothetical protein